MCIKPIDGQREAKPLPAKTIDAIVPEGIFSAYKIVRVDNGRLISPVYHHEWCSGIHRGGSDKFNDQTGIYAFLEKPTQLHAADNETILELKIDRKNVTAAGNDKYNNMTGIAVIATVVEVTQEAIDKALNIEAKVKELDEAVAKNKPRVKKVLAKAKEKLEKISAKVKKKLSKKSPKKEVSGFASMTVDQLKTMAKAKGLTGYSKLTKPALIKLLKKG